MLLIVTQYDFVLIVVEEFGEVIVHAFGITVSTVQVAAICWDNMQTHSLTLAPEEFN